MRKKRPGSTTARLLCDSAAKLTTVSISSSARSRSVLSRSQISKTDEPQAEPVEVAWVACVRELVERDDVIVRIPLEPPANEVRADEAGGASDEELHLAS